MEHSCPNLSPLQPKRIQCLRFRGCAIQNAQPCFSGLPLLATHLTQPLLSVLGGRCSRRKQREAKKYSKAVQAERLKEKAQAKKASIASISKLRKQRARDGFAGELDLDAELARGGGPKPPGMAPGQRIRPGGLPGCPAALYGPLCPRGLTLLWSSGAS